jgi:hypothetical protein
VSPSDATSKWVSRLSGATQEITTGVANVTTAPGQQAAAKSAKWVAAMTSPTVQAKWKNNVGAVSLATWQQLMTQVGIPRIATGAQQKQGKYLAFAEQFFPYLQRGVQQIEAMDDTSLAARIQRAVAMMNYNSNFKRSATAT